MVFSLSLTHLTKLLIIFSLTCSFIWLCYLDAVVPLSATSVQASKALPTISLRQTRAIKSTSTKMTTTASTTTTTTKPPKLPLATGRSHNKQSPGEFWPTGHTTANKITTSARPIAKQISLHKTIRNLAGYTALGHTSGNDQSPNVRPSEPTASQLKSAAALTKYKLPSWFNYERYKRFYGKQYRKSSDNEIHRRIYLRTALKVFEQRALYRAGRVSSLASMNEMSDLTSEELEAFRGRLSGRLRNKPDLLATATELKCCTYDQVYSRIIELLNRTSSGTGDVDLALSRAFIEELEQKSLVEGGETGGGNEQVDDDDDDGGGGSSSGGGGGITDDANADGDDVTVGEKRIESPTTSTGNDSLLLLNSDGSLTRSPMLQKSTALDGGGGGGGGRQSPRSRKRSESGPNQPQIGSIPRNLIGVSGNHHQQHHPRPSSSNETQTASSIGTALEAATLRHANMVEGPSGAVSRLLGQQPLATQRVANGTLLEADTVIEHKSQQHQHHQPLANSRQQQPDFQPKKQSALMGPLGANEAEEIGKPATSNRPMAKFAPNNPTKTSSASLHRPKWQQPPRTGNGSLTIGETANGSSEARAAASQHSQASDFLLDRTRPLNGYETDQQAPGSMQLPASVEQQPQRPKATRAMFYPLTQQWSKQTNATKKTDDGNPAGAPTDHAKTWASFAAGQSDSWTASGPGSAHGGAIEANMGGQPRRRPLLAVQTSPPAAGKPAQTAVPNRSEQAPGWFSGDAAGPTGLGAAVQPSWAGEHVGGDGSRAEDGQQQQQDERGNENLEQDEDGPKLSSAERAIAESVRRQVEQQLSGNSTIGRQLTEQFSAYFGEPVVLKATLDEAAVKRALSSARGAKASSGPSPPPSSSAAAGNE